MVKDTEPDSRSFAAVFLNLFGGVIARSSDMQGGGYIYLIDGI